MRTLSVALTVSFWLLVARLWCDHSVLGHMLERVRGIADRDTGAVQWLLVSVAAYVAGILAFSRALDRVHPGHWRGLKRGEPKPPTAPAVVPLMLMGAAISVPYPVSLLVGQHVDATHTVEFCIALDVLALSTVAMLVLADSFRENTTPGQQAAVIGFVLGLVAFEVWNAHLLAPMLDTASRTMMGGRSPFWITERLVTYPLAALAGWSMATLGNRAIARRCQQAFAKPVEA